MRIIGLTGGIGSGKSLATTYFKSLAVDVIDADEIARSLLEPGQPAFTAVVARYGNAVLTEAKDRINRHTLRDQALFHPKERQWLEALLHPQVKTEIQHRLKYIASQTNPPPYVVVVAPLLIEAGMCDRVSRLVVIDCSEEQQIKRTCSRDASLTPEGVKRIIAAQLAREARCAKADDIILNDSTQAALRQKIVALHQQIVGK